MEEELQGMAVADQPEVTPEETPEVTPEETPEVTPEETPEVTPEETPAVDPEPVEDVPVQGTLKKVEFEGLTVVSILDDHMETEDAYHCQMSNHTTMHVPKSLFI